MILQSFFIMLVMLCILTRFSYLSTCILEYSTFYYTILKNLKKQCNIMVKLLVCALWRSVGTSSSMYSLDSRKTTTCYKV